jgi:hypothetical protein
MLLAGLSGIVTQRDIQTRLVQCGAIDLIHTYERMQELAKARPRALAQYMDALIASLDEAPATYHRRSMTTFDALVGSSWSNLLSVWQCHNLFTTCKRQFGLGPEIVKAGDVVVILVGCPYPAVLRPHESWYYFVGNAHVSDVGHPEILEVWNSNVDDLQEFEIR